LRSTESQIKVYNKMSVFCLLSVIPLKKKVCDIFVTYMYICNIYVNLMFSIPRVQANTPVTLVAYPPRKRIQS